MIELIGDSFTLEYKGWVAGYIVGSVNGIRPTDIVFEPPYTLNNSIVIADDKDCREYQFCVPISIEAQKEQLNLTDNPDFQHKKILIEGTITRNYKMPGIKDVKQWIFVDE